MNDDIVAGFDDEKNDSIKLKIQKIQDMEGGLIVYASGYIDTYNSESFRKRIEKAVETGFVRIVVEMTGVSNVSSTGIGAFTYLLRIVKPYKGDMVLTHVQPKVYEIFQLMGFSQFFLFTQSLDESIAYLTEHLEPPPFPKEFICPVCGKQVKASKAGLFRCSECKTILTIDEAAGVKLG
jgi:anti-sigma B factor antagonist